MISWKERILSAVLVLHFVHESTPQSLSVNQTANNNGTLWKNATQPQGPDTLCSIQCECEGTIANCSNRGLQEIPGDLTPNIVILDLSGNAISEISEMSLYNLVSLESLDISNNNISSIRNDTFSFNRNLMSLDIRNNPIEVLSVDSFNILPNFTRLKTDLFGICCVFSFLSDCQGPTEFGYSTCDALMKSSGLIATQWIIFLAVFSSNIVFLTLRFQKYRNENSKTLLTLSVNLCVSYMLGALGVLVIASASVHYNGRKDFLLNFFNTWVESAWCSLAGVLHTAANQASIIFMLLICAERFSSVVISPNTESGWRIWLYVACPVAWLIAFALASVPLVADSFFVEIYYSWSSLCVPLYAQTDLSSLGWQYSFAIFFVVDLVLLIITLCLYMVVLMNSEEYTQEQDDDVLSRAFELDKLKTVLPAVIVDMLLWLPLVFLSLLGPTGVLVSISTVAWISTVAHQVRGIACPLALIYWTTMSKPKLSHRASTRKAQAIKKIRCMSIPNVEAGFVQLAHQALMQNAGKAHDQDPAAMAKSLMRHLSQKATMRKRHQNTRVKGRASFTNGALVKFAAAKRRTLAEETASGLKLTLEDINNLLLEVGTEITDLKSSGMKDIVIKEDTILVEQSPGDRLHFSIKLRKVENSEAASTPGDGEVDVGGSEEHANIDHDEDLANLVAKLIMTFKPLSSP